MSREEREEAELAEMKKVLCDAGGGAFVLHVFDHGSRHSIGR